MYTPSDIKHLELMLKLASLSPIEPDEVVVEQTSKPSLDESILNLCASLRSQGFVSHAESLEKKFLLYKTATNGHVSSMQKAAANTHLYRAHDEDGEDVINFAHPDGDPNMGDGDLGDVETIVSKHKKIVDVIQKTPTGKLGSYIEQCKIALGVKKTAQNYDAKITQIVNEGLNYAVNIIQEIERLSAASEKATGNAFVKQSTVSDIKDDLKDARQLANSGALNYNKIMEITKTVDGIPDDLISDGRSILSDGGNMYFANDEEGQKLFEDVKEQIARAKSRFNAAFELLRGRVEGAKFQLQYGEPSKVSIDGEGQPEVKENAFAPKAQEMLNTLGQWKMAIDSDKDNTPEDKQSANAWIDTQAKQINALMEHPSPNADQQLAAITKNFPEFQKQWVG